MLKVYKLVDRHIDVIFEDLMRECRRGGHDGKLSNSLRVRLESLREEARKIIVSKKKDGCSPLFYAIRRGQADIAEYLIKTCKADVDQRGSFEVLDDKSVHYVTPLWLASVTGQVSVIPVLLNNGADINAQSDSGSTPVRSACFMSHFQVVKLLVERGADINKANYNGGTCLINAVQSPNLCKFLIDNGAEINAMDIQHKTALHYAVQEYRLDTVKLLLESGADPLLQSRHGDDVLQTACIRGSTRTANFLIEHIGYSPERIANAYELLGATILDNPNNNMSEIIRLWEQAIDLRLQHNLLPKTPELPLCAAYRFESEFASRRELDDISFDLDAIRIQSLLICERVLGVYHKDTVFRIMCRGANFADILRYQQCIDLWRRSLEIRIAKDSIFYWDTCFTAQALVRLMLDLHEKNFDDTDPDYPFCETRRFDSAVGTFITLTKDITSYIELLKVRPVFKRQLDGFDRILRCLTHLIYLMNALATTAQQKQLVFELVSDLIRKNPRSSLYGDTLLHLVLSSLNTIKSTYFPEEILEIFPKTEVVQLLLNCGANIHARNSNWCTPLHIATNSTNFRIEIIELLLANGAHIDVVNKRFLTPAGEISASPLKKSFKLGKFISLQCLAANAVVSNAIAFRNRIPRTLEQFVAMHLYHPAEENVYTPDE